MSNGEKICGVVDWGVVPYAGACTRQEELVRLRKAGEIPDLLVLCEHPAVITLGRNAARENILASNELLAERGVELHECNRGGDVTFHGPGQLVGYPIMDLHDWKMDVAAYVRALEDVLIRTVSDFGVDAHRIESPELESQPGGRRTRRKFFTGIWTKDPTGEEQKLAAIGVYLSRWVTSHGFALNITTDLRNFDLIVPCGINDKGVTSLEYFLNPSGGGRWAEQSKNELMEQTKKAVINRFGAVFNRSMQQIETSQSEAWLGAQQTTAS
jgi:lipoyl(octanoyl) transferase